MQFFLGGLRLRVVVAHAAKPFLALAFVAALLFSAVAGYAKIGAAYQMQLGNPSNATATTSDHVHYLIQRDQYAMDYNDTKRVPNWVSWDLTTTDVGGSGRSSFATDPDLPAGFTIVGTGDYSGSGYDRGHMCPSADRTLDAANNQIVFYMTNMVPQAPDNNQGVWANFETECRNIAAQGNELLIICGGSNYSGNTIASGVAIPGYVWKIALVVPNGSGEALDRITTSTRVIAIKIPNIQGVRSDPWTNYLTSIAQIEADTGFTFLTALPSSVANVLRTKVDGQTATGMPIISVQPASQTAALGGAVTFSVTATGDAPLGYQWSKDDVEISGATSSSLTVDPIQASDAGSYTVTISNNVGSTTSSAATLDITGIAPSITTDPTAQTVSAGTTAIFNVGASGSATLGYQWRKNTQPLANGGNVSGATAATLTIANAQSADAALYDVVVTNSVNTATSAAVALQVNPAAPTLTTPPTAASVLAGATATFTVAARGTTPFTYQWSKDGNALTDGGNFTGATAATLSVANVSNAELGSYSVTISNGVGSPVTSNAVALTLKTVVAGQLGYSGGTYTQNFDTLPSSGTFTLSGAGPHALDAAPLNAADLGGWHIAKWGGTGTNELFNVGTGSLATGSVYSFGVAGTNALSDRALGSVSSGSTVSRFGLVMVNTTGRTITQFTLSYIGEQWRDGGNSTPVAQTLPFEYSLGATDINTGTFTAVAALNFVSPKFTTTAGAIDGNANANRTALSATVTGLTWNAGQTLVLRWNDANDAGNDHALAIDDLSFTTPDPAPAITLSPSARSVTVGASTTLTVSASGNGLSYQWRKGGQPISGNATATTSSLSLANVTLADAGDYDAVVTNSGGSATSDVATVTVLTALETWRQTHFGSTANSGNAADAADPDGDGLSNLVEYALGLDPAAASVSGAPVAGAASGNWTYTFTRPSDRSDLTYEVEASTDLVNWSATGVTLSLVSETNGVATYQATYPTASADKFFFRLKITAN
ncbi:MAG: immunoglobulin domain-containing protein [Opitutae bacterium]|nr:immunoglobulin domain-containing protein [Opitutae bacterium]